MLEVKSDSWVVGGYDPFEVGGAPVPGSPGARPKKRSVLDGREEDLKDAIRIAKAEDERIQELVGNNR